MTKVIFERGEAPSAITKAKVRGQEPNVRNVSCNFFRCGRITWLASRAPSKRSAHLGLSPQANVSLRA